MLRRELNESEKQCKLKFAVKYGSKPESFWRYVCFSDEARFWYVKTVDCGDLFNVILIKNCFINSYNDAGLVFLHQGMKD